MKKFITLLFVFVATLQVSAQTDSVKSQLDHIFQYINKSQIPTGYLDQYGAQFVDKKFFNGVLSNDNLIRDLSIFKFIYNDIVSAKINPAIVGIPDIDTLNRQLDNLSYSYSTPLIIHISRYDSLREDGIQKNLFTYSNNQIFDKPGRTLSPYISKTLFAVCPITPNATGNTIDLSLDPSLFYSNCNKQMSSVFIDFLDGQGYQMLTSHFGLSKTYTDSSGFKKFAIKMNCTDGSTYYCYSGQYVDVSEGSGYENGFAPLSEQEISNPLFTKALAGQYREGKVYVRYSEKRKGTALANKIVKPFIVVEGYDIHDIAQDLSPKNYGINELINGWNDLKENTGYNFDSALDLNAGYDLIFVDYYTMDSIENNAKMLEAVIDEINLRKVNNASGVREQNVVMGISMGGLVSRYCLAKMTKTRGTQSTDTRMLFTMDSPHQGANIPLGFQHFIYDFGEVKIGGKKIKTVSDQLKQFYDLQKQPATAQQLIARVMDGVDGNVIFNTFLQDGGEYRNTITFNTSDPVPSYTFKAISQGSQCGQWVMAPGTNLADVVDNKMAAVNVIFWGLGKGKYRMDLKINALPAYGSSNIICNLKVQRNVQFFYGLIGTGWVTTWGNKPRYSPSNIFPWDCVPGSTQSASGRSGGFSQSGTVGLLDFIKKDPLGFVLDMVSRPVVSVTQSISIPFNQDIFSFVPITSSLDIQNPTLASFNQSYVFPINGLAGSSSSKYIAQEQFVGLINDQPTTLYNLSHTDFTARNAEWIFDEMENISNTLNCSNECNNSFIITGNGKLCLSESYTIPDIPLGATVNWSASPIGLVNILPNGNQVTLTKQANGNIILTAEITTVCGIIPITKIIEVGLPYITQNAGSGSYYSYPTDPDLFGSGAIPNQICTGEQISVTVNVERASGVIWSRTWAQPSNTTWSQSGNSLSFYLWGNDQKATYKVSASNVCGSVEEFFPFKSINCGGDPGDPCLQFIVSPNPANNVINVMVPNILPPCDPPVLESMQKSGQTNQPTISQLKLYTQQMKPVKTLKIAKGSRQSSLNISGLTPGVYILEISDGKYTEKQKVIIL